MSADNEVTLTVHGLDVDNGNVRADVFIEKFKALLACLKLADKQANEQKIVHDYVIVGLETASAHATLRERVCARRVAPASSVRYVEEVFGAIYNGDRNIVRYPREIVRRLTPLVAQVGRTFSHAEIAFSKSNVVRIDDFLAKQLEKAVRRTSGEELESQRFFEGVAFETLDGIVKEIDARGTLVRGKIILTVGGKELDCVFNTRDFQELRNSFNTRARVEGVAHYDGQSLLPVRLDVRKITLIDERADLLKWKGSLKRSKSGGTWRDD